jgi:hypothetical protein
MARLKPIVVLLFALALASQAWASQSVAHVYVALKAYDSAPQAVKELIDRDREAYLAGATGPDICLLTYLSAEAFSMDHPGLEAHYNRTGQIIMNMLKLAAADPDPGKRDQGIAFALGWITHYSTDCVVHAIINNFGGYFEEGGDYVVRHKHLELAECEHVFSKNFGDPGEYTINPSEVPASLITAAFNETFPDNIVYKPITQYSALGFTGDVVKSAVIMQQAGSWFHSVHVKDPNYSGAVFSMALKGTPPTPEEYRAMMQPLKIDRVELEPPDPDSGETRSKMKVTYTVNDFALHKLFFQQFDSQIGRAISDSVGHFGRYIGDPATFRMLDRNLDTGGPIAGGFDVGSAWPGRPEIRSLLAFVKITDPKGKEVPLGWEASGQWIPCPLTTDGIGGPDDSVGTVEKREGWCKAPAGTAFFRVPVACTEPGVYSGEVRLAFANRADKRLLGWPEQNQTIEAQWKGPFSAQPDNSIMFVVDTSGSMAGSKLTAAIAAVKDSVDQTNDQKTEWCLAHYGGCGVSVICKFTMEAEKLKAAAETLSAGGDTPLSYARSKTMTYLTQRGQGKIRRLIILCDGQDNCPEHGGVSQPEASAQLRKLMRFVTPVTIGPATGGGNR